MKTFYIYSGKGGVGKSTVCVNIAYALNNLGYKVGIIDADISGPSISSLVCGIEDYPPSMKGFTIIPGSYGGVLINSTGFISSSSRELFFSGKYLKGALHQLAIAPQWDVDLLLIDLPPGTDTIHQELLAQFPGKAVVVTLPTTLAYSDVLKGIDFIRRLDTDIIGYIENMSYYKCSNCYESVKIFHSNNNNKLSDYINLKNLAKIPVANEMSESVDAGVPFVNKYPNHAVSKIYNDLASEVVSQYDQKEVREGIVRI